MTTRYAQHVSTRSTPQTEPIPGSTQVTNAGGGFAWAVTDWQRLARFLILGSEGGSYYATERALTIENSAAVLRCITEDGPRVVREVVAISDAGRAPKNDPALFVLAVCMKRGDEATRRLAHEALPKVARIGTHLFHLAGFVEAFGGWGRATRRAFAKWYTDRPADALASQLVKYQGRDGWTHRDVMRLAHPKASATDAGRVAALRWAARDGALGEYDLTSKCGGRADVTRRYAALDDAALPALVRVFEAAKSAATAGDVARIIYEHNLPRECVPTQFLNDRDVWAALLPGMGIGALVRNLGKMTAVGLLGPGTLEVSAVCTTLTDTARIRAERLHPMTILIALRQYVAGHGDKGKLSWTPVARVVDALDAAFYTAFASIESTGKRYVLGLDVSGSMAGAACAGASSLTARDAACAMAMVTARTEPACEVMAFSRGFVSLSVSPRQRLDDVIDSVSSLPFDATDCAQPMLWALAQPRPVLADVFVIYTDSETNVERIHPAQALQKYREATGINARLIVVAMSSGGFTIADPNDGGMLDVVGFDASVPAVMAEFVR